MRRLFEVNSEPHIGARPSVRLCVGLISPKHNRTEGRAPVWGFEFTSKAAALQGDQAETAAGLNVKLWDSVLGDSRAAPFLEQPSPRKFVRSEFSERFEPLVLVYASVLRALPPAAPHASPIIPARGITRLVLYIPSEGSTRRSGGWVRRFRSGWSGENTHPKTKK